MYNYYESMRNDIREWLDDHQVNSYNGYDIDDYDDPDELKEDIYNDLWTADSVTGNGSGSYTFNTWQAEENLFHNMDLLKEACDMFGCDLGDAVERGAEYCDVTIRCYLLDQVLNEVLDEDRFDEEFYRMKEEREDE